MLGLRLLNRQPASAGAIVLTLALGIGATTATYAVFNQVLFRPARGVADPASLVTVHLQAVDRSSRYGLFSHAFFVEMQRAATGFSGLTSEQTGNAWVSADPSASAQSVELSGVSRGFFSVLGLRMRLGRSLGDDEVETPGIAVAVISEVLWRRQFAASADVVGQTLYVNRQPFTVAGVVADYRGWSLVFKQDLWIPAAEWQVVDRRTRPTPYAAGHSSFIGRLAPGRDVRALEGQVASVFKDVDGQLGRTRFPMSPVVSPGLVDIGRAPLAARLLEIFRVLASGSMLLLLLACANAANLAVVRASRRRRELAVRLALGAGRWRLVGQQIAEAAALAALAWGLGLGVAAILASLFRGARLLPYLPDLEAIAFDWRVLVFSGVACALTTIVFSVLPAWFAASVDPRTSLQVSRGVTGAHHRVRASLVALQFALSLGLVVSAALLTRSLDHLRTQNLGFDPRHVVEFDLNPADGGYDAAGRDRLIADAVTRLGEMAGVDRAGYSSPSPTSTGLGFNTVTALDTTGAMDVRETESVVSPAYFETMKIPLLQGRTFTSGEFLSAPGSAGRVVVLSASLARQLFGDGGVGRRLAIGTGTSSSAEVIGIVGDVKSANLRDPPPLRLYKPAGQEFAYGSLLVRSARPAREVVASGMKTLRELAPTLPMSDGTPMADDIDRLLAEERLLAKLMGVVAVIAGVLAIGGLYAVVAFIVAERTRELGIRLALGAQARSIASIVLGRVAWMCAAGTIAGVGLIALSSKLLASRLFGVTATDPATIALAAAALGVAAVAAGWLPARRATRIDPTIALRAE